MQCSSLVCSKTNGFAEKMVIKDEKVSCSPTTIILNIKMISFLCLENTLIYFTIIGAPVCFCHILQLASK